MTEGRSLVATFEDRHCTAYSRLAAVLGWAFTLTGQVVCVSTATEQSQSPSSVVRQ
ncbi:MAG TPA: hypothetical protein QGF35_07630 [Dehalococcoidia bacterium]|nr:hypothetical protein [Dehalococcoidia bacterium]